MSELMAEMLELSYLQNSECAFELDSEQENVEVVMERFAEKTRQGNDRRLQQSLYAHLKNIHERVGLVLRDAGYSDELPEPRLDTTVSFQPPEFCIKEETKETEGQKLVRKACAVFMDCAQTRNDLVKSVLEWMEITSSGLDGKGMRSLEHALARREVDASKSRVEVKIALSQAKDAIAKLIAIRNAFFDEKTDECPEKSAMPEKTLALVNERIRRNTKAIDAVPATKRSLLMKWMFSGLKEIPPDMTNLLNKFNINAEEEQALVVEITSGWKTACNDIWRLLISVHEGKILQRSTKLKIRRILYMLKLVLAVLEMRDGMVSTAERQLLNAQTEVLALKTKLNRLEIDSKNLRETCAKTRSIVVSVSKERDKSNAESEKLREDLETSIDKIADLNSMVKELKKETVKDSRRLSEVNDLAKGQDNQMEEMQPKINNSKRERDAVREKLEEKIQKAKENEFFLERRMYSAEGELKQANVNIEELLVTVASLEEDLLERDKEFMSLKVDLEAKEEVICKLTRVAADGDNDSDSEVSLTRRRSLSKRQSSHAERTTYFSNEAEERLRKFETPSSSRRLSIVQVAMASTTNNGRRSSIRLIPPPSRTSTSRRTSTIPAVKVPSGITEVITPASVVPEGTAQQVSAVAMTLPNGEYIRLKEGWEESDRRCREVEADLAYVEDELTDVVKLQKRRLSVQAREFRIQTALAGEQVRGMLNDVYTEALNTESMVKRYKSDLALILDQALLPKIAEEVRNVQNYASAQHPTDHAASLKISSQWIDFVLTKMLRCQVSVIRHMQNAVQETKMKTEEDMRQEDSRHVKVLADKSMEIERYKTRVNRTKNDVSELKAEIKKLSRLNEQMRSDQQEQWKQREKQSPEVKESLTTNKKTSNYAQEMEPKIRELKADFKKLKSQLEVAQHALARETQLRLVAERAAYEKQQSLKLATWEDIPTDVSVQRQEEKPKISSLSQAYAKTLRKLLRLKPTLRLSHITDELANEVDRSVKNYMNGVATRLAIMCRRYIAFRRCADVHENIRTTIKASKAVAKDRETKAKWRETIEKLQTVYWHLQSKQEATKRESEDIKILLSQYRNDLGYFFRRVAQILLKRKYIDYIPPRGEEGREAARQSSEFAAVVKLASLEPPSIVVRNVPKDTAKKYSTQSGLLQSETSSFGKMEENVMRVDVKIVEPQEIEDEVMAEDISDLSLTTDLDEGSSSSKESETDDEVKEDIGTSAAADTEQSPVANHSIHQETSTQPGSTSTQVFAGNNALANDFSEEYIKNQNLLSAVMKSTSNRCSAPSPEPTGPTWDRRASLSIPPATPAWTCRPSKVSADVPKTLQLDIHRFIHRARKQLQEMIRRHPADGATDKPLTSSSLSDLGAFMRSRRATITGGILPGILEGNEAASFERIKVLKRFESSMKQHCETKISPVMMPKKISDSLEVQVVQPPANYFPPKSPRSPTKLFTRRPTIRKNSTAAPKQDLPIERVPSMRERFESDMKYRELKKVERCLSDDVTTSSYLVEPRKSTSDSNSLPSISNISAWNN